MINSRDRRGVEAVCGGAPASPARRAARSAKKPVTALRALFLLTFLAAAACARIPAQELTLYSETFVQARTAGDLLLDEVSPIIAAAEAKERAKDGEEVGAAEAAKACEVDEASGYRPCFKVSFALGEEDDRIGDPVAVKVQRSALQLIAAYNQLVARLAAGESAAALSAKFEEIKALGDGVSGLAPVALPEVELVKAALGIVQNVAENVETARANAAAASSVLQSRGEIKTLIRHLIDLTPTLYEFYASEIFRAQTAAQADLNRARFTKDKAKRAEEEAAAEKAYADAADRARRLEAALVSYVRLLDRSAKSLDALATAIEAPTATPIDAASTFIRQATEARIFSERVLGDIRALRASGSN